MRKNPATTSPTARREVLTVLGATPRRDCDSSRSLASGFSSDKVDGVDMVDMADMEALQFKPRYPAC